MIEGKMVETELQKLVRMRLGLRIDPQMAEYLGKRLADTTGLIPLIGGDARTGTPRRELIDPRLLRGVRRCFVT